MHDKQTVIVSTWQVRFKMVSRGINESFVERLPHLPQTLYIQDDFKLRHFKYIDSNILGVKLYCVVLPFVTLCVLFSKFQLL